MTIERLAKLCINRKHSLTVVFYLLLSSYPANFILGLVARRQCGPGEQFQAEKQQLTDLRQNSLTAYNERTQLVSWRSNQC